MFKVYYDENNVIDKLEQMSYKRAALEIASYEVPKKVKLLKDIQEIRDALDIALKKYNASPFDPNRLTTTEFEYIMFKVKKLDFLRYQLLEMPILMEETDLDKKIRESEKRLEQHGWDANYERRRKDGDCFYKVNAREEYEDLIKQRLDRGQHTNIIAEEAAELVSKYL